MTVFCTGCDAETQASEHDFGFDHLFGYEPQLVFCCDHCEGTDLFTADPTKDETARRVEGEFAEAF